MSTNNKHASAILGSPFPGSTSEKIVKIIFDEFRQVGWTTETIDLSQLDASALLIRNKDKGVEAALESVLNSDLIITASPTYRATYTGLLKVFLDQLPQDSLSGKLVLPVQTGGSPEHSLSIEHGISPVMRSLGAIVLTNTIYAWSGQIKDDGGPSPEVTSAISASLKELNSLSN